MTRRRWDPRTQQPANLTGRELELCRNPKSFPASFFRSVISADACSAFSPFDEIELFPLKKHPVILKSGYHSFLVKRHQMNSLHVHVMFSLWQLIGITLSQRFEIKGKRERMWNIYIWKPHGDDRQQREKYRESDCKETCVAQLSKTNFTHNF